MTTHTYGFLPEQAQEDTLHANRLLSVEERPFQRVTRNLLGKESLLRWTPRQLPSPPPDGEEESTAQTEEEQFKRQKFRDDILLDFAALESSIVRIQLILTSNAHERQRYAAEKAKIVDTAQAVKENTQHLRTHLNEAQRVLGLRKGYDELAARLIDPRKLKPRAETREDISRLEKEIEDLELESTEFDGVWSSRRELFERVVVEGNAMVRVIKGIKDEPEMEAEKEENGEEGEEGVKGERSIVGSPAPGGDSTPMPASLRGGETPMPDRGDDDAFEGVDDDGEGQLTAATPPTNKFLEVEVATRTNSRIGSPSLQPLSDVEMDVDQAPVSLEQTQAVEEREEPVASPAEGEADVEVEAEEMDES